MTKRRIAVIVAGMDQSYQKSILNGLESAAAECMLDFTVFASFSGTMGNPRHDKGEFAIFRLPEFTDFDGAVLLTNTIDYPSVVQDIITKVRNANIPAVSIDNDIPDMMHIGIDNSSAMRKITEHFINHHGYTRFNYISGPVDNPESADRLKAFRKVLDEHGIAIDDNRIFYGDFRAPSGRSAIDFFRENNHDMPQVIICANDVMAATAINRLSELGINVPDDIAVSGFDNTYGSANFQIEITTVERPLVTTGQLACKMLYDFFNNVPHERSITLSSNPIFSESCGCGMGNSHEVSEFRELNVVNYRRFELTQTYMSRFNRLSCDLLGVNTFGEYIGCLKAFVNELDPQEFYFCLCENWDNEAFDETRGKMGTNNDSHEFYTDTMRAMIIYKNGSFYPEVNFDRSHLLPDIANSDEAGKVYYMVPLHFSERCLGYMAIMHSTVPIHNSMFQSWCITISNSLENIRKLMSLDDAVKRLEKLYAQDTFSGIYNRNGFVQATDEIYRRCMNEGRSIMLMFIDLDGLKSINDTYGHSTGDNAICCIADVLRKSCQKNEIYCRFGGDEFIVFGADYTDEDARRLTDRINENIGKINADMNNPFMLSASTGYVITVPKPGEDLFRFVSAADQEMYEEKRKKKMSE